jgi:hypothetical protein
MTTAMTEHELQPDQVARITERLLAESKAVQEAFAQLDTERAEAWDRHAAEIRATLDRMQLELDRARDRLDQEHQRTREEAEDELDELLSILHGQYDDLRLQVRLGEMDVLDRVAAIRDEAGHLLERGRTAVRRARCSHRELVP